MLPSDGLPRRFTLQIKHVLSKIVQLRLIETRRQNRVPAVLQVLQCSAQTRNHSINFDSLGHYFFERSETLLQLLRNAVFVEKIPIAIAAMDGPNRCEEAGNGVRLDDAARAPDLKDRGKVDLPPVLGVGGIDDVDALDVAGQARCVDC